MFHNIPFFEQKIFAWLTKLFSYDKVILCIACI